MPSKTLLALINDKNQKSQLEQDLHMKILNAKEERDSLGCLNKKVPKLKVST